jgi:hypothetical protein
MAFVIRGFDEMIKELNRELERIPGATIQGLIKGARLIRETTETVPPLTPVDLGNLRASWYVVTSQNVIRVGKSPAFKQGVNSHGYEDKELVNKLREGHGHELASAKTLAGQSKFKPSIVIGYSAFYAGFVHENLEATEWTRSGSGPKWFQSAVYANLSKIINIVIANAKPR